MLQSRPMARDEAAGRTAPPSELSRGMARGSAAFLDGALANPALLPAHLLLMLRNPSVTSALIARVSRSPFWMRSHRLRQAIALHPRSPRATVMGLLSFLRWGDLARVAASPFPAASVRAAAERILLVRLPEMATGERVSLARIATATVVRGLRSDDHPLGVRAVLQNPQARVEDALFIAARPESAGPILRSLAESRRFVEHQEVRLLLALHPSTPKATALRMLSTLDVAGLTLVAASDKVPRLVRVAAERRLSAELLEGPSVRSQI